jgi:radical SAM protein with 4Fe4S-binding SPASM domain
MYDIRFFRETESIKERLVSGAIRRSDMFAIEQILETIRSKSPHIFNIETTNHCNMTCIMCPRTTLMTRDIQWMGKGEFQNLLDQITPHSEESLNEFWHFIREEYGINSDISNEDAFYFYIVSRCVILHGFGEPLIDKNIADRVQACTDRGIPTYFSCVPANINLKKITNVLKAGLTVLKFSLDGMDDELQKKIRGKKNNFDKSYEAILDVINLKEREGFKTMIVPCMIALSEDSLSKEMHHQFLQLWEGKDVFAYVKSQDNRWYHEEDSAKRNRSHYAKQYCEFPWTSMTVMANGKVVPCTQDYNCEISLGNASQTPLKDIWNGEEYRQFRQYHVTGNFPKGHKCVDHCDQTKLFQKLAHK